MSDVPEERVRSAAEAGSGRLGIVLGLILSFMALEVAAGIARRLGIDPAQARDHLGDGRRGLGTHRATPYDAHGGSSSFGYRSST